MVGVFSCRCDGRWAWRRSRPSQLLLHVRRVERATRCSPADCVWSPGPPCRHLHVALKLRASPYHSTTSLQWWQRLLFPAGISRSQSVFFNSGNQSSSGLFRTVKSKELIKYNIRTKCKIQKSTTVLLDSRDYVQLSRHRQAVAYSTKDFRARYSKCRGCTCFPWPPLAIPMSFLIWTFDYCISFIYNSTFYVWSTCIWYN